MHSILDTYFQELHKLGLGAEVKKADLISKEEENALWENGVLGVDTSKHLFRAVFFYSGKNFCLRGGKETIH